MGGSFGSGGIYSGISESMSKCGDEESDPCEFCTLFDLNLQDELWRHFQQKREFKEIFIKANNDVSVEEKKAK